MSKQMCLNCSVRPALKASQASPVPLCAICTKLATDTRGVKYEKPRSKKNGSTTDAP
jgi:hypothetical protein